ncbi:Porin O precursor [Planctomycetes bacterium Pan216]|uniref:Porin O n=1 Tax=Kolteria novifilia TaxID=2527975 RepID=A0A518AYP0_9BACT|nr:Porin O precursor [Planctomycetes bacterium Pan216]
MLRAGLLVVALVAAPLRAREPEAAPAIFVDFEQLVDVEREPLAGATRIPATVRPDLGNRQPILPTVQLVPAPDSDNAVVPEDILEDLGEPEATQLMPVPESNESMVPSDILEDLGDWVAPGQQEKKKYPNFALTGLVELDSAWISQSPANVESVGVIDDELAFRRARVAAYGSIVEHLSYILEMDFALAGRPSFVDAFAEWDSIPLLGTVRVGRWRQPFGLESLSSIRGITFLERGEPIALAPFRRTGVGFFNYAKNERVTWALSTFRSTTDQYGNAFGNLGGQGLAGRVTVLPIYKDGGRRLFHLGASYNYMNPGNNTARFFSQPEIFFDELATGGTPQFVDTGNIDSQYYSVFGTEIAGVHGPWSAQAEWIPASVQQTGGPQLFFSGAYAYVSYILTGESRGYDPKLGVFTRVTPTNSFDPKRPLCFGGAWELAARYSYLNLNSENITGGEIQDFTWGVNWYLVTRFRLQFNYIHTLLDRDLNSTANSFALRAQFDF